MRLLTHMAYLLATVEGTVSSSDTGANHDPNSIGSGTSELQNVARGNSGLGNSDEIETELIVIDENNEESKLPANAAAQSQADHSVHDEEIEASLVSEPISKSDKAQVIAGSRATRSRYLWIAFVLMLLLVVGAVVGTVFGINGRNSSPIESQAASAPAFTAVPTWVPSLTPTSAPSLIPTLTSSLAPSSTPTVTPTLIPTLVPTQTPIPPPTPPPTLPLTQPTQLPTKAEIQTFVFEIGNLDGNATHMGTIRIQSNPDWGPIGVRRFHVSSK